VTFIHRQNSTTVEYFRPPPQSGCGGGRYLWCSLYSCPWFLWRIYFSLMKWRLSCTSLNL